VCVIYKSVLMIAEFYKVLLTLYYISHLPCQRQLTTKWKLGLTTDHYICNSEYKSISLKIHYVSQYCVYTITEWYVRHSGCKSLRYGIFAVWSCIDSKCKRGLNLRQARIITMYVYDHLLMDFSYIFSGKN
jgi:hypothetical protein